MFVLILYMQLFSNRLPTAPFFFMPSESLHHLQRSCTSRLKESMLYNNIKRKNDYSSRETTTINYTKYQSSFKEYDAVYMVE